jgi:TonB family protein
LILDFKISGTGSVASADVKESSLSDARLDDCVLRRLMGWKFPKPNGGVTVAVSYPFVFKALKR